MTADASAPDRTEDRGDTHQRIAGQTLQDLRNVDGHAEIMTVDEVARQLHVSKAHVHNLINGRVAGPLALPVIKLGRRRLVRRVSLNEWLRANEHVLG